MFAERGGDQNIDSRIKKTYIPIGRKALEHITKRLADEGLLDEEEQPLKPLTEEGLTLLVKDLANGIRISLSNAELKNLPDGIIADEVSIIDSIGNAFKKIDTEPIGERGIKLLFSHMGCPIKELPLIFDPGKVDEQIDTRTLDVVLRKFRIVGLQPDRPTGTDPKTGSLS